MVGVIAPGSSLSRRLRPRSRNLLGGAQAMILAKPAVRECRAQGSGFRVWGLEFRVKGLGFRVYGLGFRV